jgi:hypothetical protein
MHFSNFITFTTTSIFCFLDLLKYIKLLESLILTKSKTRSKKKEGVFGLGGGGAVEEERESGEGRSAEVIQVV